jgi:hypothetical protein
MAMKSKSVQARRTAKLVAGKTIKFGASFYSAVKESADKSHRSVPKQVEYLTALGQVLDNAGVSKDELLDAAQRLRYRNTPSRANGLLHELARFFASPPRGAEAEFVSLIEPEKGPVYGTSVTYPGKMVQRWPDGSEVIGTVRNGAFVAEGMAASPTARLSAEAQG